MPYPFLMREYTENEETFESQINQNPRSASATTFDRPLLMRNTVRFDELPWHGPVSITWDFAGPFNQKKRGDRDFSTGCVAQWNEKSQCFIIEIVRKRFRPADLAQAVVDLAVKYHPFVIGIEDAGGSQFLEDSIKSRAELTKNQHIIQVCSNVDWITPDNGRYGKAGDAKKLRMAGLHPWLVDGRLKFANFLFDGQLETLYNEFEKCLHSPRFDDIPDVISYQPRYAPRITKAILKANDPLIGMSPDKAEWNLLYEANTDAFGRVGFAPPTPVVTPEPEPDVRAQDFYPGVQSPLGAGFN